MYLPLRTIAVLGVAVLSLNTCIALSADNTHPDTASSAQTAAMPSDAPPSLAPADMVTIAGPLRSLFRMAGISQDIPPAEVLPMLARNISLWGYKSNKPTEYLILLDRYVHQARELQALAGPDSVIRVAGCDQATRLIQVLGYQFQQGCGPTGAALSTADAERAFITIDSGFPITALEESLQKGTPFAYDYPATPVPILFTEKAWTSLAVKKRMPASNILDVLLHDENIDRLYSALARKDAQTAMALERAPGLNKLIPLAPVLDFYGSRLSIRSGAVTVPGGAAAEVAWKDLVGSSPRSSSEFVTHLFSKDHGWLAAYFDSIARTNSAQQAHFTEPARLKSLYEAYLSGSRISQNTAAQGVFPRNSGLLVLLARLQWQPDGQIVVPGSLQVWKEILAHNTVANEAHITAHLPTADTPEHLLDAIAASSIVENGAGPTQIYLLLSAIDNGRTANSKLSDSTVSVLASRFPELSSWFPVFAEFPTLSDAAIVNFIDAADRINKIQDSTLRSNALGAFQSEVGLWQILARQGQIPEHDLNQSWQSAINPYAAISSSIQLFDAARSSFQSILRSAGADPHLTQDQFVDLLAGPAQDTPDGRRAHQELARRIRTVMVDQHLVSLETLFGLFDGLNDLAHGAPIANNLIILAGDLREFELPRPIFTGSERTNWAPLVYTTRHVELQVRTDLTAIIRNPSSPAQLELARGRLAPFLRDTLVGLNYAYYEPPGAQVLHHNPLFVRSHDFTASSVQGIQHIWAPPQLIGVGVTAGGGAYLLGSLADLPYSLAALEQDFISPTRVQALIWKEIVPEFLVGSVVPRWWGINKDEMHAVALYQRAGEELLAASARDSQVRERVLAILAEHLPPDRLAATTQALFRPEGAAALIPKMLPTDTFFLAVEFRNKYPDQLAQSGDAGRDLNALVRKDPLHTSPERISKDFGLPHLEIAQSESCTVLNLGIFPASAAFSGRLFAESWESSNIYWARLADEMGYSPAMLNLLVPNLTRRMVANIFATNIDDWPALLRALVTTGDEFRRGDIAAPRPGAITGQIEATPTAMTANAGR